MTTLDILILVVFIASAGYGFYKGMIVQVGALVAILFAVVLCRLAGGWLAGVIAGHDGVSEADVVIAKVTLFVIGYLSVRIAARFIKQITHALALGALDRLGGALFSLFQWMLVLSLLMNLWFVIKPEPAIEELATLGNGHVGPAILHLAPAVLGWVMG